MLELSALFSLQPGAGQRPPAFCWPCRELIQSAQVLLLVARSVAAAWVLPVILIASRFTSGSSAMVPGPRRDVHPSAHRAHGHISGSRAR